MDNLLFISCSEHTQISCRLPVLQNLPITLTAGQLHRAVRWSDGVPPPLFSFVLPRTARILRDGVPAVRTAKNEGRTLNRCGNPKMVAPLTFC